jgi:hypothetical protein
MDIEALEREPWIKRPNHIVERLLPLGMAALEAEDRSLAVAFGQCPERLDVAHGLSYQVYEHILQYGLFKAWLPVVRVDWDCRYDEHHQQLLDLCVRDGERTFGFELKWWGNKSARLMNALKTDVERLQGHATAEESYLLAFWWGSPVHWHDDARSALTHGLDAETVYVARFRTHGPREGYLPGERYFAMSAMRVNKDADRS